MPEIETTEQVEAQELPQVTIEVQQAHVVPMGQLLQEAAEATIEAVLPHPEAIILDEPLGAINPEALRQVEITIVPPVGQAPEVTAAVALQEAAGPVAPTEAREVALEAQA